LQQQEQRQERTRLMQSAVGQECGALCYVVRWECVVTQERGGAKRREKGGGKGATGRVGEWGMLLLVFIIVRRIWWVKFKVWGGPNLGSNFFFGVS
jgi:hypothetical protein